MTELEHAIAATLRADAQEAAMSTDTTRESEKLQVRLDDTDRSRRRRTTFSALVAVAAVAVVAAGAVVLAGRAPTQQVVAPTAHGTTHHDPYFTPPFTMTLPAWVVESNVSSHEDGTYSWWTSCDVPGTCADLSVSRFDNLKIDGLGPTLTYDSFVAHLADLSARKIITITGSIDRTVDGRRAVEIEATSTKEVDNVLGCAGTTCQDVQPDMTMRYVVVDMGTGQTPVVIFSETANKNPQRTAWLSQLDTVLDSIRFGTK
jgi:hypothetical protein